MKRFVAFRWAAWVGFALAAVAWLLALPSLRVRMADLTVLKGLGIVVLFMSTMSLLHEAQSVDRNEAWVLILGVWLLVIGLALAWL